MDEDDDSFTDRSNLLTLPEVKLERQLHSVNTIDVDRTHIPVNNIRKWHQIKPHLFAYLVTVHAALILTCWILVNNRKCLKPGDRSFSPALSVIKYETKNSHFVGHGTHALLSGPPSPENNHAWDQFVKPTLFRATYEEMVTAGEDIHDAAELIDGGYLASTSVYHDLHCLRQLRLYLYKESYYHNLTSQEVEYLEEHLDHCIETLRLSIMCGGDVSMYTFHWDKPHQVKPTTKTNSRRQCISWEPFEEWGQKHMVETNPRLKSPKTGV
ncbi:hypothetical protein EYC80_008352 [Monilinia laxa]|uniref:Tat pathway signal sequence n=1 Tax=Monilinia laxa TaxID=61186 RepID=A0A5N6JPZ9_MONLA|nr:hypothetical protein EYC80_008352 [Monilinia laxa]